MATQKNDYLTDLAESDSSSATYLSEHDPGGDNTLLAYGLGFCSFLLQGANVPSAISSLDSQAREEASKTGFTAFQ
jgi:hypothetical protein